MKVPSSSLDAIYTDVIDKPVEQGHPMDRFGKVSVRKALIPYAFLKRIFTSNFRGMGNSRPGVFGLIRMSFRVPKKGQLRFSERK